MLIDSVVPFLIAAFAALLIGIGKTGVPGLSLLFGAIMALAIGGKASVGMVLLLLCVGDAFAVLFYRKHAQWGIMLRLLPALAIGIAAGTWLLDVIADAALRPVLGTIILALLAVDFARDRAWLSVQPKHPAVTGGVGVLAGITTVIGNAAGPIMSIYYLMLKLDKYQFMGTAAWLFFIVNLSKVPLLWSIEVVTRESLVTLLALAPFTIVGALIGKQVLRLLPMEVFSKVVLFSALITASSFILSYWLNQ